MDVHGAIDKRLYLSAIGDVGANDRVLAETELVGQSLEPVQAPGAKRELRAGLGEMARKSPRRARCSRR
jgi:hypothetical protein